MKIICTPSSYLFIIPAWTQYAFGITLHGHLNSFTSWTHVTTLLVVAVTSQAQISVISSLTVMIKVVLRTTSYTNASPAERQKLFEPHTPWLPTETRSSYASTSLCSTTWLWALKRLRKGAKCFQVLQIKCPWDHQPPSQRYHPTSTRPSITSWTSWLISLQVSSSNLNTFINEAEQTNCFDYVIQRCSILYCFDHDIQRCLAATDDKPELVNGRLPLKQDTPKCYSTTLRKLKTNAAGNLISGLRSHAPRKGAISKLQEHHALHAIINRVGLMVKKLHTIFEYFANSSRQDFACAQTLAGWTAKNAGQIQGGIAPDSSCIHTSPMKFKTFISVLFRE